MKRDKPYLQHMHDAIIDIERFVENTDYEAFLRDRQKQYAVLKALEIIGEASKNVSTALKAKYPAIPWRKIAAVRNVLIHEYFGVKVERVWEMVQNDVPELKTQITVMLNEAE